MEFRLQVRDGAMLMLTGFVLQAAGFVPNEVQSMQTQIAIVSLYSLFPLVCYAVGAMLFRRFKLNEQAYAEIRSVLNARRTPA